MSRRGAPGPALTFPAEEPHMTAALILLALALLETVHHHRSIPTAR
jgi:hypothetical protein